MRKLFLIIVILFLGFIPVSVRAQTDIHFSSVNVQIWPDYDQPNVLVIYHYVLADDVSLPATVDLLVPIQASVNAVATSDASGGLLTADYSRTVDGDWAVLTTTTDSQNIQVEYYDNYLLEGQTHLYSYTYKGSYAVDMFIATVQQPVNATNLTFSPDLGDITTATDGMTYYSSQITSLAADQTYSLSIQYDKADDILSASQLSVQPSAPLDNSGKTWTDYLPWIVGILGGLLVIGGLIFGLYSRNKVGERSPSSLRKRHKASNEVVGDSYCPQCGKRSQPGDVFCRTCGSRLRRSG
ncbi:MAG: zinc ribbon domain-containing protein [Anaerolineales bacterium]